MNLPDMESIDEQLTAYLDGELSPAEASSLERNLVDDEKLRLRLVSLRQAYDLLDEIPETPHNQRFTKSTLELVIKDLSTTTRFTSGSESKVHAKPADWWAWPRVTVLLATFVILGVVAAVAINFENTRRELKDLGLIAGIRGLEDINELKHAVKLSKETEILAVLRDNLSEKLIPPPPDSTWQRKTWVQGLTPNQISRLDSGREILSKLDRETRTRLAAIESQIESLPDHRQIQETVHLIGLVLDSLGSAKRLDMEVMKSEQRYEFLKELLCMKAAEYYAARIPSADAAALEQWDLATFRPALLLAVLPDRPMEAMDTRSLLGQLLFRKRIDHLEDQDSLIAELTSKLSPTATKLIEGVNKAEQIKVLNIWLFPNSTVSSTETLIDFYDKMDNDIWRDFRDRIDLVDPQDVRRRLFPPRGSRRP